MAQQFESGQYRREANILIRIRGGYLDQLVKRCVTRFRIPGLDRAQRCDGGLASWIGKGEERYGRARVSESDERVHQNLAVEVRLRSCDFNDFFCTLRGLANPDAQSILWQCRDAVSAFLRHKTAHHLQHSRRTCFQEGYGVAVDLLDGETMPSVEVLKFRRCGQSKQIDAARIVQGCQLFPQRLLLVCIQG